MIHVALYEPEIPPNTGNIARLCAGADVPLHIVGKPVFSLDDKHVRRAGLDYWPYVKLAQHESLEAFQEALGPESRIVCLTTKATTPYTNWEFRPGDCIMLGPESRGLPAEILAQFPCLKIPIFTPYVRSLNLGNSAAIVLYEAIRQLGSRAAGCGPELPPA